MMWGSAICKSTARLDGKTAVVTGCNTGIGKITVEEFYKRGARVIMACRNLEKAQAAMRDIKAKCKDIKNLGEIIVMHLDLQSLASVRSFSEKLLKNESKIHLLVNNAAIMLCPKGTTDEGYETQWGVNHLAHFTLTLLLLPRIIATGNARIINVSSGAQFEGKLNFDDMNFKKRPYNAKDAYHDSKLMNVVFTSELAKRLKAAGVKGVTTYSLHPGVIATELARHFDSQIAFGAYFWWRTIAFWFIKTPWQGTQTTLHCALDEQAGKESGLYYAECAVAETSKQAQNEADWKTLWDISVKCAGLENYNPFVKA